MGRYLFGHYYGTLALACQNGDLGPETLLWMNPSSCREMPCPAVLLQSFAIGFLSTIWSTRLIAGEHGDPLQRFIASHALVVAL